MLQKQFLWITILFFLLLIGCSEQPSGTKNADAEKALSNFTSNTTNDRSDDLVAVDVGNPIIPTGASPGVFNQAVYDTLGALEFSYGGLNYDKWYVAGALNGAITPTGNHPLWTGTSPDVVNESTWRCKQCHAWDYSGVDGVYGLNPANKNFSGICGILPTANCPNTFTTALDIWNFLHDGGTTPGITIPTDHAFADFIPDEELYALTKFIMTVRDEATIGNAPADKIGSDPAMPQMFGMAMGSQSNGYELYNLPSEIGGCDVACHGADGKLIDFKAPNEKYVDTYANENPWEVLHKIRFGHPGSDPYMPGIAEYDVAMLDMQGGIDILSYSQAGLTRSNIVGGRLYDDWIVETGADATQAMPNPLLTIAPDQGAVGGVSDVDGWRCSQCHGFDFEGGKFGFINNLVELTGVNNWEAGYVFQVLKNGFDAVDPATSMLTRMHVFGGMNMMSDEQLWNLSDFLVKDIFDTHTFIRAPTGGIREPQGNELHGQMAYNGMMPMTLPDGTIMDCVSCHGADGKLAVRPDGSPTDLFMMSWMEPWKYFHQTKFGTPRLPDSVDVMPGLLEATRDDGHAMGNHDVANVQLFSQKNLLLIAPGTVASIKSSREEAVVK